MTVQPKDIAATLRFSEHQLIQEALISPLRDKKRQILQLRLDSLSRYEADSFEDLENRIRRGDVPEHPA